MIRNLVIIATFFIRIFFIFKVIQGLYFNHMNPDYSLNNIEWYIYALFIDFYIIKIFDNPTSEDIYSKKDNE